MFADSHCHLEDEAVLLRAFDAGVDTVLNAGKDVDESAEQVLMCEKFEHVYTSAGVHPDTAPEKLEIVRAEHLLDAAKHPKVIAIGECGLDYHYGAAHKEAQKEMFYRHVEAAAKSGLPLMIHQREAEADLLALLDEGQKEFGPVRGVIHCFSSDKKFAEAVHERGFYISASGILTFKSAGVLEEIFATYPQEMILIETDSPYLAPVPYRGKVNEPAFVRQTAAKLAALRGLTIEEIARITKENFYRLYRKAK
jgi:TatD DNase family protein